MIRNVLILVYVLAVLIFAATAEAAVEITSTQVNADTHALVIAGLHDFKGPLEITPRVVHMNNDQVIIDMEPSCGRSCRPSQEKPFVSVVDVTTLGLPVGKDYKFFVLTNETPQFVGSVEVSATVAPQRQILQGNLKLDGDKVVLQSGSDNIYLSIPQQVNVAEFLNKTVVISGFKNVDDQSQVDFTVQSIAESNIL